MISRRAMVSAALVGLARKSGRAIAGTFVNDGAALGHTLRDHRLPASAKETISRDIVIVGGGIAGLSAAWRLRKRGFHNFVLLEMERQAGGNSRFGENEISSYPWGAHYVPVPGPDGALVRELMRDLGVLQADGTWSEQHLCFTPKERVFLHGRWQEGLEPEVAATPAARGSLQKFEQLMQEMSNSGQFRLPMDLGTQSSSLDNVCMKDWLRSQRLDSAYLDWYVDYACRDDYGARMADVSAWAGIHYFASRGHQEDKGPLTWPEGNGWIVRRLAADLSPFLRTNCPVVRIEMKRNRVHVLTPDTLYETSAVVFAAPTFLAKYLMENAPPVPFVYSPWVTANLTLDRMPRDVENGNEPAWDNVIYDSPALGYVDAEHMSLRSRAPGRSVWTWYMALAHDNPAAARTRLLQSDWSYWRDFIMNDLARPHPDIRDCVARIDVMRFGHAMARPVPGMLTNQQRRDLIHTKGAIFYANSDLSGLSLFEEAQYRGVQAADKALRHISRA